MRRSALSMLAAFVGLFLFSSGLTADDRLPGDTGRPNNGVMPVAPNPAPAPNPNPAPAAGTPRAQVRAPGIDVAVEAARAIVDSCKQFHLGVAVVNAEGAPILIYIPDGSNTSHAFMALRKAYTAVTFKVPSSQLVAKAQQDADFAAKIHANTNLLAYSGGLVLMSGNDVIGGIGVSGAEPGHHDEECGLAGLEKIKDRLK